MIDRRHAADPAGVDRAVHDAAELVEVQRLQQVLEGPQLHRLDRGFRGPVGRDHDHRQPGVDAGGSVL